MTFKICPLFAFLLLITCVQISQSRRPTRKEKHLSYDAWRSQKAKRQKYYSVDWSKLIREGSAVVEEEKNPSLDDVKANPPSGEGLEAEAGALEEDLTTKIASGEDLPAEEAKIASGEDLTTKLATEEDLAEKLPSGEAVVPLAGEGLDIQSDPEVTEEGLDIQSDPEVTEEGLAVLPLSGGFGAQQDYIPDVEQPVEEVAAKLDKLKDFCFCPLSYEPVCDSNGKTHPNKFCAVCNAEHKGTYIVHKGPCDPENKIKKLMGFVTSPYTQEKWPFPCYCPKHQALICDSEGVTHYNVHCMKCYKPRGVISKDGPCDENDPRNGNFNTN